MCWNYTSNVRVEMPFSSTSRIISNDNAGSVIPGMSTNVSTSDSISMDGTGCTIPGTSTNVSTTSCALPQASNSISIGTTRCVIPGMSNNVRTTSCALPQASNSISIGTTGCVIPGTSTNVMNSCTPPPSYYNINLPLGHPSTLPIDRGAPPSYEEAIDPNAPPPSYDSLFGRMREAHKVSKGVFDFLKNIIVLLLGTIGCTIILGVTIVVPICMMIIGALYLYDCPQGEYIPVYLLVGGGFGVFKQLLHLSARVRQRQEERDEERIRQSPTQTLINCFMLGWFIIGSMWVYKEYEPNYDPSLGKYCNKTLYLFAFWLITSVYICLGVITAGLCSISVASIAFQRPPPDLM